MNKFQKKKILILVEGEKTDKKVMKRLLKEFAITEKYEIVHYGTNIYSLYNEMFKDTQDISTMDILQVLKSREKNEEEKEKFNMKYTDILLVFDLDPQDPQFNENKIIQMQEFFNESTDMGKLYINYPMIESFYHIKEIPDDNFLNRMASLEELQQKSYKKRSNIESIQDYTKFFHNYKDFLCTVIKYNLQKAYYINENTTIDEKYITSKVIDIDLLKLLKKQIEKFKLEQSVFVLCTCIFFIYEYNPKYIQ